VLQHGGQDANADADVVVMPEIVCDDFASWNLVSDHLASLDPGSFEARVLDSNGNGIPCEGMMPGDRPRHRQFEVVCDDFQHRDEAEQFFVDFEEPNSNRYGLDHDLDNRPCEMLPPLDDTLQVLNRLNRHWLQDFGFGGDRNCTDFETWAGANAYFILAGGPGSDPHQLDGDGDGVPCEALPGAPD
jgi:hypothetical protein